MGIILHGTWQPRTQRFFLWGEDALVTSRRGRKQKLPPHPFQASLETVAARLNVSARASMPETRTIWLPSVASTPIPSPELVALGALPRADPPALAPWRLSGMELSPDDAIDVLLDLPRRECGADLLAWREAALLALSLVVGQQALPALRREGFRLRAFWMPRPPPETARALANLAAAMPPLCRAVVDDPAAALAPRALLDDFISAAVDALVRSIAQTATLPATTGQTSKRAKQAPPAAPATPAAAWMAALAGPDALVALTGRAADELHMAWQSWAGQTRVSGDDVFRITFRLEPPLHEHASWSLSYFLQAVDDPSLLAPASHIWRERGALFTYLDRRFDHPQERLLRGLGFAARIFPPIEASLRVAAPDHAEFDAAVAFTFLKDAAPLLEQSGFGVLAPAWWSGAGRLRARARVSQKGKSKRVTSDSAGQLTLESMIAFDWEVTLGGETMSRAEFERLVALKQPLVRVRGEWVALDPEVTRQALAMLQHGGEMTLAELLRLDVGGAGQQLPNGVTFDGLEAEGAVGNLLRELSEIHRLETLPQPAGLRAELRPYQMRGFSWMAFMRRWGLGACLADDMGLGKSIQTIALILQDRAARPDDWPALIVCPTSVIGNWRRELARFAPELRVHVHQGTERLRADGFAAVAAQYDVVITSYPLLARDRETLTAPAWRLAALDEAQNIKNSETRQARAARSIQARARIALTGTPVENRLTELWSIMAFLNPGYLGNESEFRRTIARPIERTGDKDAAARLKRLTAPFILRRLKTDPTVISDLPDKIEMKVFVPLTAEQATLYEATVRDALAQLEHADEGSAIQRRGMVLAMLMKLKQVCNHPAQFLKDGTSLAGRSGKLARLEEMLDEARAEGDRALIFTQFAEMGGLLQSYLRERIYEDVLFLHGGTPARERDGMVRRFQADNGPGVFVLSLRAGGVGLNLTRANHVFHFDRWWNPAVENQATDRAFRIGQTRNVQVYKFVCAGTLEERIDAMIAEKQALAESVLGAGENWLTELTTAQLRDLVTLRREDIVVMPEGTSHALV